MAYRGRELVVIAPHRRFEELDMTFPVFKTTETLSFESLVVGKISELVIAVVSMLTGKPAPTTNLITDRSKLAIQIP